MGEPAKRAQPTGTSVGPRTASSSETGFGVGPALPAALDLGTILAQRYEITALLGEGGMGHVYKAYDRELDRNVALKTIRPDMASNPSMLGRFKQEVALASSITHRNVVRLYDLGESESLKFITMEFIDGDDLRVELERVGRLTPVEATETVKQVLLALEAAHAVGVIHRDLKPRNIMREKTGRVVVMDFGLARNLTSSGMTQTGALVGTMDYMSPEQAMGGEIDARSDLFAAGLILFESLTGKTPYEAESAIASLVKRSRERAVTASSVNNTVPQALSNVVAKALERDVALRYQSAREMIDDLEAWQGPRARTVGLRPSRFSPMVVRVAGGGMLVLLMISGVAVWRVAHHPATEQKATETVPVTSLAIVPFRNASQDASLEWLSTSLPEMLRTDIGQTGQFRIVASTRVQDILKDMRLGPDTALDPTALQKVAEFANARVLVDGEFVRAGDQIRLDAVVHDLEHNRTVQAKAVANSDKEILGAVDQLARSIREGMALSPQTLNKLQAAAFKPSTQSLEALRAFEQGRVLAQQGRNLDAIPKFQAAVQADPNFAMAHSRMAQAYAALGRDDEAQAQSRQAVLLASSLPEPERYRIEAAHAVVLKDYAKAENAYQQLEAVSGDPEVQLTLAKLYEATSAYDKAQQQYDRVLQNDPNSLPALLGSGRIHLLRNDPQGSLDPLNRAISVAVKLNNDEQKAQALQAVGVAYRSMQKPSDALRYYNESLELKQKLGDEHGVADAIHAIAQAQADLGKTHEAMKSYQQSLAIQRRIKDTKGIGDTLIDLGGLYANDGKLDDALKAFREAAQTEREVGDGNYEALALNNAGATYFLQGHYEDARIYYQQALQLREKLNVPGDVADTLHNLGETSTYIGDYDQALKYYVRALELRRSSGDQRGAALDSLSMGTLFCYQGRFQSALSATGDAVKYFRDNNDKSPSVAEVLLGHADALNQAGRTSDSASFIAEGQKIAAEAKNDALVAQATLLEGDRQFYRGDLRGALAQYNSALAISTRNKDKSGILTASARRAQAEAWMGKPGVEPTVRSIMQQANGAGLKYLRLDTALTLADIQVKARKFADAQNLLNSTLAEAEQSGTQLLVMKAHAILGRLQRAKGDTVQADQNLREADRLLKGMEQSDDEMLQHRSDLAALLSTK